MCVCLCSVHFLYFYLFFFCCLLVYLLPKERKYVKLGGEEWGGFERSWERENHDQNML